jgi:hypothetical protein
MLILAIDLGKTKSLACWYQTDDTSHEFRTVPTRPGDFPKLNSPAIQRRSPKDASLNLEPAVQAFREATRTPSN